MTKAASLPFYYFMCVYVFKKNIYMSVTRGTRTWGAEKSLARPGREQANEYLESLVTSLTGFPVHKTCSKLVVI